MSLAPIHVLPAGPSPPISEAKQTSERVSVGVHVECQTWKRSSLEVFNSD